MQRAKSENFIYLCLLHTVRVTSQGMCCAFLRFQSHRVNISTSLNINSYVTLDIRTLLHSRAWSTRHPILSISINCVVFYSLYDNHNSPPTLMSPWNAMICLMNCGVLWACHITATVIRWCSEWRPCSGVLSDSRHVALFRIIEHLFVIHASGVSAGHIPDPPGARHVLSACMTMRHI